MLSMYRGETMTNRRCRVSGNRRRLIVLTVATLVIGLAGCASHVRPAPPRLAEEVRPQLETIGIASDDFSPEPKWPTPTRKGATGALKGAGKGFALGLAGGTVGFLGLGACAGGAAQGCGIGLVGAFVAAGTPVWVVGGAIHTAKEGVAEARLIRALDPPRMRETVARVARNQAGQQLIVLPAASARPPVDRVTEYGRLASQGIQTLLEISVINVSMQPVDSSLEKFLDPFSNPNLRLAMTVRARLIRLADSRKIVYDHAFDYSGSSSFRANDWANDDAQSFRNELDRAYETLADEIVQALFDVKIDRPGSRPPYGPPDETVEPLSIGAIRESCWSQDEGEPSDHPVRSGENLRPSEDPYVRCVARRLAIWGIE